MPSVDHELTAADQQAADRRRAAWTAQLLTDRAFRTEQIKQLDREAAISPPLGQDAIARVLRDNAQTALRDIDDALARLTAGRFGRCVTCGQAVDPVLLDVLPVAAECMSCRYDADEVQRRGRFQ